MAHKLTTMPFRPDSYAYDINNLERRITRTEAAAIVTPFTRDAFGYGENQLYLGYENHGDEEALAQAARNVVKGLHAREQVFYKQPLPTAEQWNSIKQIETPVRDLLRTAAHGDFAMIFGGLPLEQYQQLAQEGRESQTVLRIEAKRMYSQLRKKMHRNHQSINLLDPRVREEYQQRHRPRKPRKLRKYYTD